MERLINHKKGQFVIIAVLIIAIMIISIGAMMHRAVTYYTHEPWEEYLTLIGNIELSCRRLVEISLAKYSNTLDPTNFKHILKDNAEKWQSNITKAYPGRGVSLNYSLAEGSYNVYGMPVKYDLGLNHSWDKEKSFTAANATFALNVTSIGLSGYEFTVTAFLLINSITKPQYNADTSTLTIDVNVTREDNNIITTLKKENFQISLKNGDSELHYTDFMVALRYQNQKIFYTINCIGVPSKPTAVIITVQDSRDIRVRAIYSP